MTHFYDEYMKIVKKIKPKKKILTILHSNLDYKKLKDKLEKKYKKIYPAYDGMKIII